MLPGQSLSEYVNTSYMQKIALIVIQFENLIVPVADYQCD